MSSQRAREHQIGSLVFLWVVIAYLALSPVPASAQDGEVASPNLVVDVHIDANDLIEFIKRWRDKGSGIPPDFTGDRNVGDLDLFVFQQHWEEMTAPSCFGPITITTQADANELEGCVFIEGDLTIGPSTTELDLSPLSSVCSISGSLMILGNNRLASLQGLETLVSVGKNLEVGGFDLEVFPVQVIGGGNNALTDLNGLNSLISVGGNLGIYGNRRLSTLRGVESLAGVEGDLDIVGNDSLRGLNGLQSLTRVGGSLHVGTTYHIVFWDPIHGSRLARWNVGNDSLVDIDVLQNLTDLGGTSHILFNRSFDCSVFDLPFFPVDESHGNRTDCNLSPVPSRTPYPTPTPSHTPTRTMTPFPASDVITAEIPGLPPGARPLQLARIPAGSFDMGSPDGEVGRQSDEGPVRTVVFDDDFHIGTIEITQAQWFAVMGSWPGDGSSSLYDKGDDFPIHLVTWDDINQPGGFLDNLNELGQGEFRLPSEAEWEYACRAGTGTRFFFGDSLGCTDTCVNCPAEGLVGERSAYMWYCWSDASNGFPRGRKEVGRLLPNQLGLFDLSGNQSEWCRDVYHSSYDGAPTDGTSWEHPSGDYRAIRGGSWRDHAFRCRSAARGYLEPNIRSSDVGFRVVRNQ